MSARARKNKLSKEKQERAKQALEKKQDEAKQMVDKYFEQHDTDGDNTLGPDEIRKLLLQFCKNASDISMNSAISKIPKAGIHREQLPSEFVKIRGYLDQQIYIDKTFLEFDIDRTGFIGRDELTTLMTRMTGGAEVSQTDVDFVLKKCDVGAKRGKKVSDGLIDRNEILPVISLWKQVLIERVKGNDPVENDLKSKSQICIIS